MSDPMFSEQFYFNEQSQDLQANQMDYQAGLENFHVAKSNNLQRQELPKIQIFSEIDNQINLVQPGMQFEEIRMDRLNILNDSSVEAQPRSGSDGDNSRGVSSNDHQGRKQKKTKKEDQQQLKDRLQSQILLNLGQTKILQGRNPAINYQQQQNPVNQEANKNQNAKMSNKQSMQNKVNNHPQKTLIHLMMAIWTPTNQNKSEIENPQEIQEQEKKYILNYQKPELENFKKKMINQENHAIVYLNQLKISINNKTRYNFLINQFQQFLEQQQKLFERLETCLIQGKDIQEIEILLDALKYRTSSSKQERLEAAKSFSYSILDVCLPLQTKYLFSIVEVDKDFFSSNQKNYTDYLKDILKKSEMKPDQSGNIEKTKQKLIQTKQNIRESFKKIKNEIKIIQNEAVKVDQLWEQLKENLPPDLLAQCLITLHKNQFRADFQVSTLFKKHKSIEKQEHQLNNMQIETQINQRKQVKKSC